MDMEIAKLRAHDSETTGAAWLLCSVLIVLSHSVMVLALCGPSHFVVKNIWVCVLVLV